MAIMILNWFELDDDPNQSDPASVRKAKIRNRDMIENANSGLQYYGMKLAEQVATVPVGVPDEALVTRPYEGDTRQPLSDAYPHAVAAMACMHQYLSEDPLKKGLYHMGAADRRKLAGGNHIQGGTLQALMNQGAVLVETASVFAKVLTSPHGKGRLVPVAAVVEDVRRCNAEPEEVGKKSKELVDEYRSHLDWLKQLGVDKEAASRMSGTCVGD